jgi:hypothetical protein
MKKNMNDDKEKFIEEDFKVNEENNDEDGIIFEYERFQTKLKNYLETSKS